MPIVPTLTTPLKNLSVKDKECVKAYLKGKQPLHVVLGLVEGGRGYEGSKMGMHAWAPEACGLLETGFGLCIRVSCNTDI